MSVILEASTHISLESEFASQRSCQTTLQLLVARCSQDDASDNIPHDTCTSLSVFATSYKYHLGYGMFGHPSYS